MKQPKITDVLSPKNKSPKKNGNSCGEFPEFPFFFGLLFFGDKTSVIFGCFFVGDLTSFLIGLFFWFFFGDFSPDIFRLFSTLTILLDNRNRTQKWDESPC